MITIYGSHGEVFANEQGEVIGFDNRGNDDGSVNEAYGDIARFDFAGKVPESHIDILDVGYWLTNGYYEPPAR